MMKQLLSKKFLPTTFDPVLFQQYRNFEQGNRSVLEYGEEFHKLSTVLDLEKLEIQRVARFISGLRENIRDKICLLSLWNLSETIDLSTRIEMIWQRKKKKTFKRRMLKLILELLSKITLNQQFKLLETFNQLQHYLKS